MLWLGVSSSSPPVAEVGARAGAAGAAGAAGTTGEGEREEGSVGAILRSVYVSKMSVRGPQGRVGRNTYVVVALFAMLLMRSC